MTNAEKYEEVFGFKPDPNMCPTSSCAECPGEVKECICTCAWWDSEYKAVVANSATSGEGEWISVSERLPDDMQKVLIWFEYYRYGDFNCMYQTYGFGYVCDGKWSKFINGETGWQDARIIAWQPLPEPYEKGGAE